MSHRKFCAPRRGSLGFLPRSRATHVRGRIRAWPRDDSTKEPHLTAFLGYKAGMTHVLREVVRAGSRLNKKQAIEPVTVVETPPLSVIGVIGYHETPQGLKPVSTAWANFVAPEVKRRFYKNWYQSKNKPAFGKLAEKIQNGKMDERFAKIAAKASVIRVIAHTQPSLVKLGSKKAEIMEIQVNGGDPAAKLAYARGLIEKQVRINEVFTEAELVDLVSVGKGRGWEGVVHRYGTKLLQKKTHRGRRKVACIGPWNPMRILWSVARAGNNGFHHRTEINKRIYRVSLKEQAAEAGSTEGDLTKKGINPIGGFTRYGNVQEDFILIKGSVCGITKRLITLRKSINTNTKRIATEAVALRWIDTASKFGHGRFQTKEERRRFLGLLKIGKKAAEAAAAGP
jgi:large subunit ribosomal protein L3e